jgi:hypothetical protein
MKKIHRNEVVAAILSKCEGASRSELTRFGSYVSPLHPIILEVHKVTGIRLTIKDIEKRTVGKIADTVMDRFR